MCQVPAYVEYLDFKQCNVGVVESKSKVLECNRSPLRVWHKSKGNAALALSSSHQTSTGPFTYFCFKVSHCWLWNSHGIKIPLSQLKILTWIQQSSYSHDIVFLFFKLLWSDLKGPAVNAQSLLLQASLYKEWNQSGGEVHKFISHNMLKGL